jgi:hypothetical protein
LTLYTQHKHYLKIEESDPAEVLPLSALTNMVKRKNPSQYQLPHEYREFFEGGEWNWN